MRIAKIHNVLYFVQLVKRNLSSHIYIIDHVFDFGTFSLPVFEKGKFALFATDFPPFNLRFLAFFVIYLILQGKYYLLNKTSYGR